MRKTQYRQRHQDGRAEEGAGATEEVQKKAEVAGVVDAERKRAERARTGRIKMWSRVTGAVQMELHRGHVDSVARVMKHGY